MFDNGVSLSLDCVTGWKALFDVHNGRREWIDDYSEIRQSLYNDEVTAKWLHKFKTFDNLVLSMKLDCFCTKEFDVIDLSNPPNIIGEYGKGYQTTDLNYFKNLKEFIKKNND